jgi:hypothetical protein
MLDAFSSTKVTMLAVPGLVSRLTESSGDRSGKIEVRIDAAMRHSHATIAQVLIDRLRRNTTRACAESHVILYHVDVITLHTLRAPYA